MGQEAWVVFWYFDGIAGEHHYETFVEREEAVKFLLEYREYHPNNNYRLARIEELE